MTDTQPEALRLAPQLDELYRQDVADGVADVALLLAADELRRLHEVNQKLVEALKESLSVCQSVSLSRSRLVDQGGYWQTEEWCRWLTDEVAPMIKAALDKARGNT